jgi:hypothetical protein
MVPPWVPPAPPAAPDGTTPADVTPSTPTVPTTQPAAPAAPVAPLPSPIASTRRFVAARRSAGNFAKTGNERDLKRSIRHYVKKGYGGSGTAASRFGGTVQNAGSLYSALAPPSAAGAPAPGEPAVDRALLTGRSARDVMDAIVDAVQPSNGTQDAEASRTAIKGSLSELLQRFPDADLLELSDEQREFAIERYVGLDVYQRFALDLGKYMQDKAPSPTVALSRLKEVKDYIKETVSAAFRKLKAAGRQLSGGRVSQIVRAALSDALSVFEHYRE